MVKLFWYFLHNLISFPCFVSQPSQTPLMTISILVTNLVILKKRSLVQRGCFLQDTPRKKSIVLQGKPLRAFKKYSQNLKFTLHTTQKYTKKKDLQSLSVLELFPWHFEKSVNTVCLELNTSLQHLQPKHNDIMEVRDSQGVKVIGNKNETA